MIGFALIESSNTNIRTSDYSIDVSFFFVIPDDGSRCASVQIKNAAKELLMRKQVCQPNAEVVQLPIPK